MFNCVQADGDPVSEDEMMESEMDFNEFQEALVAICIFLNPNPYLALEQRFETFLQERVYRLLR